MSERTLRVAAVAKAVREHLQARNESQAELAKRAGVSEPTISRLLGDAPPAMRQSSLHKIVEALPRSVRESLVPTERRLSPVYRVFLSSTYLDQQERRRQVIEAIESFGDLKCIGMDRWSAEPRPPLGKSLQSAAEADLFIGILAYRYGSMPEGETKSYVELEHDAAHQAGVDRLMFVVDERKRPMVPAVDADPEPTRWELQSKLAAFKRRLPATGITVRSFADDVDFVRLVMQAIVEWRERRRLPEREHVTAQFDLAEMRYRDALLAEHRYLTFVGFSAAKMRAPIDLQELYVPLRGHAPGRDQTDGETKLDTAKQHDVPLSQCFTFAREHDRCGVVLLGHPGSGKTTQIRRLAYALLTAEAKSLVGMGLAADGLAWLPVVIPLRQLNRELVGQGLAAAITHTLPKPAGLDQEFAEWLLERGRLVLLLDGLDEVSAELRETVADWIAAEHVTCHDSFFVVTSRFAGFTKAARKTLAPKAVELEINPLEDDQIAGFVGNWYRLVETAAGKGSPQAARIKAKDASRDLLERLSAPALRASRVAEMTANPLLLTIICLVHRDAGSYLPDDNVRLYREASEVLLERWRHSKGLDTELTAAQSMTVLRSVGRFLHSVDERTSAAEADLEKEIEQPLREIGWKRTAGDFLRAIRDDSGLLVGLGDDRYAFLHLGLQEYFAALDVHARFAEQAYEDREAAQHIVGEVAEHFGESWWQEVILILLKLETPPPLFTPFFDSVVAHDAAKIGRHDVLVEACVRESFVKKAKPFVKLLESASTSKGARRIPDDAVLVAVRALHRIDPRALVKPAVDLAKQRKNAELSSLLFSYLRELDPEGASRLLRIGKVAASPRSTTPGASEPRPAVRTARAGIELVQISGDTFTMGSTGHHADEKPPHDVRVPAFWLAETPVTNAQYRLFVEATQAESPRSWKDRRFSAPEQPVVTVSWNDAREFCEWAGLRLPTEAEWEYACRAGSKDDYSFGNNAALLEQHGWYHKNSGGASRPVGQKPANQFGLFDMHGNVWEWCEDSWHDSYEGAPDDGSAWTDRGSPRRVVRGGSWPDDADGCRSAYRNHWHTVDRYDDVGFRPASSSLD